MTRNNQTDNIELETGTGNDRRYQREVGGQRRQRRSEIVERQQEREGRGHQRGRRHQAAGGRRVKTVDLRLVGIDD